MVDCCTNGQRICQEIVFQCIATLKLVEMVLATARGCYILCLAFIGSKLVLGANEQREFGSFAQDELRKWKGSDALATDRSLRRNWGDVAFRTPSNSLDIPHHALLRMHRRIQRRERMVRGFHSPHKRSASSEALSSVAQSTESHQSRGPASRDQGFHSPLANPIADWNHGVLRSPVNDIVASTTAASDPVRIGALDASNRSREDIEEAESDLIADGREATNSALAAFDRPAQTGSRNDSEDKSSDLLTGSKVSKTSLLRFLHQMIVDENATGSSVLVNMIPSDVLQEILRSGDAAQSTNNRSSRLSHWLTAMTRRHHHTRRDAPSRHIGGLTSLSELMQQQMTHRNVESQPASPLPAPQRGAGSSISDLPVSGSLAHQYLSQSSTKNHFVDGIRQFGKQTLNKIIHKRGGTHLRILQNGTVDFVQEEDIYCVVVVKPVEQRGDVIVKIRGERSRQYLAMRQNGSLYGTADASDLSTEFFHVYYSNSHDAYRSVRYGTYVARTNDGRQPKRQVRNSTNKKAKLLVLSVSDSLLGRLRSSETSSSNTPPTSATTTTLHLPSARSSHVGVSVSPAPVSGHGESEGPPTAPSTTKVITTVTSEPAVPATITSEPKLAGSKGTKKGQRGRKCRKRRRNKKCGKSKKNRKCKKRKKACKHRNKRKSKKQNRVSRSVRSEVVTKSRLVRDPVTTHQRRKRNLQWQLGRRVTSTRNAQLRILFDELRTYLKRRSIDGT